MRVGIVGTGPAVEAIEAALADVNATPTKTVPDDADEWDLGVVVGTAGEAAFGTVAGTATPWLAVELGGVGGYPVVDAAVSGYRPGTACYDCLRGRVGANVEQDADPVPAPGASAARFAGAVAGNAAASFVAGEDHPAFGGVVELPYAERRVLPLPHCGCSDDPDPSPAFDHVDRSVEESLSRAELALDERVGVVGGVSEAESFPAPYYLARSCDTTGFSDAAAATEAAGVDAAWNAAFVKALGEALERYCAGVYREAAFERGTAGQLHGAVPPDQFVLPWYGDADPGTPLDWHRGQRLDTGDAAWLPAEFVVFPPPTEERRPAVTTGLGLGNGTVGAALSGLYETVERDAAMLSWYSTFEPLGLRIDDEGFESLARRARSVGLDVSAVLLTQDVDVPVVAAAVERDDWPRFALGSDADLDPAAAARSALAEALQNWMELRGMGPDDAADVDGAIGEYAADPGEAADFVAPERTVPAASVAPDEELAGRDELTALSDRVVAADLTPYVARLTTRDVASIGFEAVRVLVPAAQPLFFDDPFFGDRAEAVPRELGFEPRTDRDHHPFP